MYQPFSLCVIYSNNGYKLLIILYRLSLCSSDNSILPFCTYRGGFFWLPRAMYKGAAACFLFTNTGSRIPAPLQSLWTRYVHIFSRTYKLPSIGPVPCTGDILTAKRKTGSPRKRRLPVVPHYFVPSRPLQNGIAAVRQTPSPLRSHQSCRAFQRFSLTS